MGNKRFLPLLFFFFFRREQAQNVLDVTDSDVFILGAHFPQRRGRDPTHMVLIGRARVRFAYVWLGVGLVPAIRTSSV